MIRFTPLALALTLPAYADLTIHFDGDAANTEPAIIQGKASHFGDESQRFDRGEGSGRPVLRPAHKLPMNEAMSQLLPHGWTIDIPPAARDHAVSWVAGPSWDSVLHEVATKLRQDVFIDWEARHAVIAGNARDRVWFLRQGSLRANIDRWQQRSGGWRVLWQVPRDDLNIKVGSTLPYGADFEQTIRYVVDGFRDRGDYNIQAVFHRPNLTVTLQCDPSDC